MDTFNRENWDKKYYDKFKIIRDKFNLPIIKNLSQMGITPSEISWFRFVMAFIGLVFIGNYDWAWLIVYALFLIIDSWDGALARYGNLSSKKGELLDMLLDLLLKIFFVLRLIMVGYLSGFLGSIFIAAFIINIFVSSILAIRSRFGLPFFPESNLMIGFFVLMAIWKINYFDYLFLVLGIYFWVKNAFLLNKFLDVYSNH